MTRWDQTMKQTFEYYVVDPGTWKDVRPITTVTSCTISRDSSAETLGSLSINIGESLPECYIRIYLITIQNGIKEKHPLGTYLIQTPSVGFDGRVQNVTIDAYTPLLELKEKQPPLGYSVLEGDKIMDLAYRLIRENIRAPINSVEDDTTIFADFVANVNDTWITFIYDLIANAKFTLNLDEMGNVLFAPHQEIATLQPKYHFNDDNSSILYPSITVDRDLYGIPNVVEVIYSNGNKYFNTRVVNDDPNSPISTVNRGREIVYRDTNPSGLGNPTGEQIEAYANLLLKSLSTLEYTITYTHGYYPLNLGDCVMLNYERAGIRNAKAKIISQSIECTPGCPVTETAVFTNKLWGE